MPFSPSFDFPEPRLGLGQAFAQQSKKNTMKSKVQAMSNSREPMLNMMMEVKTMRILRVYTIPAVTVYRA